MLRDGRLALVPAAQLVPGDIVEVAVGGNVPADLRVAERLSTTLRYAAATVTVQSKASQPLRCSNTCAESLACKPADATVAPLVQTSCSLVPVIICSWPMLNWQVRPVHPDG